MHWEHQCISAYYGTEIVDEEVGGSFGRNSNGFDILPDVHVKAEGFITFYSHRQGSFLVAVALTYCSSCFRRHHLVPRGDICVMYMIELLPFFACVSSHLIILTVHSSGDDETDFINISWKKLQRVGGAASSHLYPAASHSLWRTHLRHRTMGSSTPVVDWRADIQAYSSDDQLEVLEKAISMKDERRLSVI
ncbi:hypothetical protein Aperf_G00000049657 [Anoplocephala perfoliata]